MSESEDGLSVAATRQNGRGASRDNGAAPSVAGSVSASVTLPCGRTSDVRPVNDADVRLADVDWSADRWGCGAPRSGGTTREMTIANGGASIRIMCTVDRDVSTRRRR